MVMRYSLFVIRCGYAFDLQKFMNSSQCNRTDWALTLLRSGRQKVRDYFGRRTESSFFVKKGARVYFYGMNRLLPVPARAFLLPALLLITSFCFAQQPVSDSLQVPSTPNPPDVVADTLPDRAPFVNLDSLHYRFFGDGAFTRGNVNRSLAVLRAEINYDGPVVSLATNPRFTYGEQNGALAERDLYVDLFVDLYKKRKVYVFGLGTIETSNLRGIILRQLAGAGVGWRLLETKANRLSLTNAIIYEGTNFRERATLKTLRNSARLKGTHSFLADKLRLNHITFLQPSLFDISNLRWSTIVSLEMPLSKWLILRTSFENTYESIVESTRQRNDSRLTVGFSIGNK